MRESTSGANCASASAALARRPASSASAGACAAISPMRSAAALVVRMKIASLVPTRAPSLSSVTKPSFQAVRKRLCTSGCAFSNSSSSTMASGTSRKAAVRLP